MFVAPEHKEQGEVTEAPAKTMDEASKLLLKAAALIETRGHCKYALQKGQSFCIGGAINYASSGSAFHKGVGAEEANDRMHAACGGVFGYVAFNNASGRTQAEVVSKLRAVALGL